MKTNFYTTAKRQVERYRIRVEIAQNQECLIHSFNLEMLNEYRWRLGLWWPVRLLPHQNPFLGLEGHPLNLNLVPTNLKTSIIQDRTTRPYHTVLRFYKEYKHEHRADLLVESIERSLDCPGPQPRKTILKVKEIEL